MAEKLFDSWTSPLSESRNELVFANRNRSYGAYQLRRTYRNTLVLAMLVSGAVFLIVTGTPKIIDILNGPEQKKKKFGLSDCRVVGIIARLSDVKGHIYLIRAMRKVLDDAPDVRLFIVGEGRMSGQIVSLIKELKMEKETVIIPSVIDTREVLSVMDIFVMPPSLS